MHQMVFPVYQDRNAKIKCQYKFVKDFSSNCKLFFENLMREEIVMLSLEKLLFKYPWEALKIGLFDDFHQSTFRYEEQN